MRRITMWNRVTADGFFAGPDEGLGWVVPEPELDRAAAAAIARRETDTILFGRRTYEQFASFWPHALDESPASPDPHRPGRSSPEMRAMAEMLNESTKLVFSRTLEAATWKNSRLLRTLDPREIAAMKAQPGKDMMIFGSGSIVSQLAEHRLIDEYRFVVGPVLLGGGRNLIDGLTKPLRLTLLEATAYPSGNAVLRYAPARA